MITRSGLRLPRRSPRTKAGEQAGLRQCHSRQTVNEPSRVPDLTKLTGQFYSSSWNDTGGGRVGVTTKDKRRTILEALERILKDRRFDEITVDEVAEAARVGKGTVYRYFKDKEDLFFQMIQQFLKDEIDAIALVAASSLSPREKLIGVGSAMSEHIQRHGAYVRMMHARSATRGSRGPHEMMREHHQRLDRILAQLLRDAESAGILRPGLDQQAFLCVYKGMIMDRTMRLVHSGEDIPVQRLVDLVLTGLDPSD